MAYVDAYGDRYITVHQHLVEGEDGDIEDALYYCSDSCHRDHTGEDYNGCNGCNEVMAPEWCTNCGDEIQ
jgi:hypothetical protein